MWSNLPIADKVPGQSDPEIDPYGSYTFTLSDSLKLQPGFTWYNYPSGLRRSGLLQVDVRAERRSLPWTLGAV